MMFFSSAIQASGRILSIKPDLSLSQGGLGSVLVPVEGCLDYIPIVSYRDPPGSVLVCLASQAPVAGGR